MHIIKLEQFEGPLDLLIYLIEKDELDIYDIPISKITAQYLSFINSWDDLNIGIATEYFIMASYLLQIKSEMLLFSEDDEDVSCVDPRDELVSRLLEYKKIRKASQMLEDLYIFSSSHISRNKEYDADVSIDWTIDDDINKYDLMVILSELISQQRKTKPISLTITTKDIETISKQLANTLLENKKDAMSLSEIIAEVTLNDMELRMKLVLILVAILEMLRTQEIFLNYLGENDFYVGIKRERSQ